MRQADFAPCPGWDLMASIDAISIWESPAEYIYGNIESPASFFSGHSTCNRCLNKSMERYVSVFVALVDEGCLEKWFLGIKEAKTCVRKCSYNSKINSKMWSYSISSFRKEKSESRMNFEPSLNTDSWILSGSKKARSICSIFVFPDSLSKDISQTVLRVCSWLEAPVLLESIFEAFLSYKGRNSRKGIFSWQEAIDEHLSFERKILDIYIYIYTRHVVITAADNLGRSEGEGEITRFYHASLDKGKALITYVYSELDALRWKTACTSYLSSRDDPDRECWILDLSPLTPCYRVGYPFCLVEGLWDVSNFQSTTRNTIR